MTPIQLLLDAIEGVWTLAAGFAGLAFALNRHSAFVEARRAARDARWEPVLLDVISGDVPPADFARALTPRHHAAALELAAVYAVRLEGDSLARLAEAMAPVLPLARRLARARRSDRRAIAARLLGLLGTQADRPLLTAALADGSPHVAMAAARALARLQNPGDADVLIAALARFSAWGTNAVASMLTLYGFPAGPALVRAFEDPHAPRPTRIACAEALRRLGYFPAAPAAYEIITTASDADLELLTAALRLIRDIGGPAEAAAVRPLLESPREAVRLHAVSALAAISQDPGDAARIEYALSDPSPWVAQRAARGLIESGRVASLHALADGRDTRARHVARQSLAEAGLLPVPA